MSVSGAPSKLSQTSSEPFAVEPAILHAAIDREAVGVELAVADGDVPALVSEHEQAHSRRLLIEHIGIEDEDRIAGAALARQLAVDHDIGLAAVHLAARQRDAVSNPLLGVRRVRHGNGSGEADKSRRQQKQDTQLYHRPGSLGPPAPLATGN